MSKVIVTGCSSGIGYYLAENIIKSGYKVIGLARNEPKEKYSFDLLVTFQLATAESRVIKPLRTTRGADNPSTPKDHSSPIRGIQLNLSIICIPSMPVSKSVVKTSNISKKSARRKEIAILRGRFDELSFLSGNNGIRSAPVAGSKTMSDNQGNDGWDAAVSGKLASIAKARM